jgi:hypothetical protein
MSMSGEDAEECERASPWYVERQSNCMRAVLEHCSGRAEHNVVVSPSSLMTCMAMLYLGSGDGRPREQLRGFCWPDEGGGDVLVEAEAVKKYADALGALNPDVFEAANVLVTGAGSPEYVARIREYFGAEVLAPEEWEAANARVAAVLRDAEGKPMNDFSGRSNREHNGPPKGTERTLVVALDTAQYQVRFVVGVACFIVC